MIPAAAQGIDAVRLMTIHGSKGLEFGVVHLPGMNKNTLPRTVAAPPCLPPDGMIEGASGTALEIFQAGQIEEQECLFYVALSRAEDRLFIYAATENARGHRRDPSEFVDRIGLVPRHLDDLAACPVPPEETPIPILIDGVVSVSGFQTLPDNIETGVLYISMEYATAAHRCCCGCGEEVVTPFSSAQWQMSFDGDAVSLRPSVGNWNLRCRSHYVVNVGQVIEAPPWTKKQIEAGRQRDKQARANYLAGGSAVATVAEPVKAQIKTTWSERLIARPKSIVGTS